MKNILAAMAFFLLAGCATVPLEEAEKSTRAKQFNPPRNNMAGIYVYRDNTIVGAALKKRIWIDNECIGQSAKGIFFYHEVKGDGRHKISTQSEFSPNDLFLDTVRGNLYFVRQYMKLGLLVGGAGLEQQTTEAGKAAVSQLDMAKKGTGC